jgi:hypothetical protein
MFVPTKPPVFVNDEGFEWYMADGLTRAANEWRPSNVPPLNATCWEIWKSGDIKGFCLIGSDGEILAEEGGFEPMAVKIDVLRFLKQETSS